MQQVFTLGGFSAVLESLKVHQSHLTAVIYTARSRFNMLLCVSHWYPPGNLDCELIASSGYQTLLLHTIQYTAANSHHFSTPNLTHQPREQGNPGWHRIQLNTLSGIVGKANTCAKAIECGYANEGQ